METNEKTDFSFEPETLAFNEKGEQVVLDSNHYIGLGALSQPKVYYTPKTNQFWVAPGKEMPKERFESKVLPFLVWDYDRFEDVQTKNGSKTVNSYPCTPENIQKKREELIMEAARSGKTVNMDVIYQKTSPRALVSPESVRSQIPEESSAESIIRRINATRI